MLKLKKVQILGFKSFCDRTEVQLAGQGIAAIVGPNGCGKSNISDAITWVLGEQSAKSLRGIKMEDVIFAGTRDRKPTGMAEVSLTLVDPEVYDGNTLASGESQAEVFGDEYNVTPIDSASDWDESALRSEAAQETEEATAEAQPGTTYEAPAPATKTGSLDPGAAEEAAGNVVLKIRRRKFGRAPVRAGELTVTRRLFRSGDSEYLLNGKICRLRDIQDIFMGTGLGGESYAIIGQERIGQLLSSKPLERRAIIEEAAGITRFKTKKRLAELRLESAKQNLSRVNDIFEEVTRQLASLKRQAAKAERFQTIDTEMRAKLRVVLASRLAQIDTEQTAAAAEIARLGGLIEAQTAELESMDAEHSRGVAKGYELDASIRDAASRANSTALELERIAARTGANADRIADLKQRIATSRVDAAQLQAHLESLGGELNQHRSFLETATAEAAAARDAAQLQQSSAHEATRKVLASEAVAEERRRLANQCMQRAAQVGNDIAQAEAALEALDQESLRLQSESGTAAAELEALGRQKGQAKLSFEDVTDRLKRVEAEISELRTALEGSRLAEAQLRREGDTLRTEAAAVRGRQSSLEALIRDHSYSTDTVRNLLRSNAMRQDDGESLRTLADFLEVDGKYEAVIDEFLRDELNYIVVKSWRSADEGVRLLQTDVAGRATFLVRPEDATPSPEPAGHLPDASEDARPLRDYIRVLDHLGPMVETILPRFRHGFVAANNDAARDLAARYPQAYFLSPSGETFHNNTVAGGKPREQGPLALKRELAELQVKVSELDAALGQNEVRSAELSRTIAELTSSLDNKGHERRDAERESANSGAALRQMESEAARIESRLQQWQLAAARNLDQRRQRQEFIAGRRQEAAELEARRIEAEASVTELNGQILSYRAAREELQAVASAAAAALAGLEERRRNASANFEQTNRLHLGQAQRLAQLEKQIALEEEEVKRRELETSELNLKDTELIEIRAQAIAEGEILSAEASSLRAAMMEVDSRLRALRHEIEAQRESRGTLTARAARLGSNLEHLEATCRNDLSVEAAALREDGAIVRLLGDALSAEEESTRELKQRLAAMGPVNMMALEEFHETGDRHSFLETQRKDLLDSIENTQASIKEIDDVSRLKFDEAYKIINENFSNTFTKLFGGGQAFMRLTEADAAADKADMSGIDIIASPPGKKLQNVLLLSGGEKALTALSLLVGIFQFQPAPFCILDEVDAPLDETNVGRFARLIAELAETTQFVIITHSKRTMEQADVMYGVTMQEPGVSKIVSVSLGGRSSGREARNQAARAAA